MAVPAKEVRHNYFSLAISRKAEEAALRRYQAMHWLECLVGPLGISSQPSERDFISCLRNGLVLCNLINKIEPGSVPKVVENQVSDKPVAWQYFENVRNFLVAIEQLKLPAFEASIFERDNVEEGSTAKVVDCILALKVYHEWKQMPGSNGSVHKPPRSPFVAHFSSRNINTQPPGTVTFDSRRQLDMSRSFDKEKPLTANENKKFQELIVKALVEHMVEKKENMDNNLLTALHDGNMDAAKLLGKFLSTCLEQELQKKFTERKSENLENYGGRSSSHRNATTTPLEILAPRNHKCCRACSEKGDCKHWTLVEMQEKELSSIKELLSSARKEFEVLQIQLNSDLENLGIQVQEMSFLAKKYHKVAQENRKLHNMVQDLKGNIRVYCRIRPVFSDEAKSVVDFMGEDGSLVVVVPLKPHKDGRKSFQFHRVFGPTATQEEVFNETQPLIRSVMDGYNVCIFAYGQTGSGKTHTMCGPSSGSTAEQGINYLALDDLFQLSNERKDIMKYGMHVQLVEIYNEQVRDLLAEDSSSTKAEIQGCASNNDFNLPNASMHHVVSTVDVINLMKFGEKNRAVASTAINDRSSRSHSVLTVHVCGEDVSGTTLHSCLHLVDLAGSERVDKAGVTGEGLREAQHINKSLSCLGDVIMALAQKNSHIPYRSSKLTLLLQNALGGRAKTLMFAHVSPEGDSFGETISTLKFAQRVSTVELGAASKNKESNEVLELKAELESLRAALANKEPKTPLRNNPKEVVQMPHVYPKLMAQRTPPRTRRLSIENCRSVMKDEKANVAERNKRKEVVQTPHENPKLLAQRTPPRTRRLSIENCSSAMKGEKTNVAERKGQRYADKTPEQIKLLDPLIKPVLQLQDGFSVKTPNGGCTMELNCPRPPPSSPIPLKSSMEKSDIRTEKLHLQLHDEENVKTPNGGSMVELNRPRPPRSPVPLKSVMEKSDIRTKKLHLPFHDGGETVETPNGGSSVDLNRTMPPRSPTSYAPKSLMEKADNIPKRLQLQQPKTPEPVVKSKNIGQKGIKSEHGITSEFPTPSLANSNTHGKGSQIRKSLRSIGKLINGSEKRSQQKLTEVVPITPVNGLSSIHDDAKSPISTDTRALRRRSLAGVLPPERSRRSSLGGVENVNRNSKTPPPTRASTKLTKRWM